MLKKTWMIFGASLLALTSAGVTAQSVHAAAEAGSTGPGDAQYNLSANTSVTSTGNYFSTTGGPASGISSAEFTIQGGQLRLIAVPDFNFSTVSIDKVVQGGTQSLLNNSVTTSGVTSKNTNAFDGNAGGLVQINDFRGVTSGWTLSLKTGGDFTTTTDGSDTITKASLAISAPTATKPTSQANIALAGSDITATGASIATAGDDQGKGQFSWTMGSTESATVNFGGENVTLKNNAVYQTPLTWTLTAAAS